MYILFDIGGTKTRIAATLDGQKFSEPAIFETPAAYSDGLKLLKKEIVRLSDGNKLEGLYGGIAGVITPGNCKLISSPNLLGWVDSCIKDDLENEFRCSVTVVNDSAIVALGEAHFGAGKGKEIVAYITVSTGVGGARIVDGKIDRAAVGFEPGHQIIDIDGSLEFRPGEKELERLISGKAVEEITGKKAYEIEDIAFWDERAQMLAAGIANTILYWSPHIVVLGGSMMNKIGLSTERVKEYLPNYLKIFPEIPSIVKSELGDLGGIYGALALVRTTHYNKSS